jgi:glycosyltransferase involved in cell wall biosynthesis
MSQGQRPQRVLLHAFSTFKLGGPQARFVQLANAMGADYHHVIVAMDNCFDAGERLDPGVLWEPLRLDVVKGGALANRGAFRAVLQRLEPDLLLSYNWGAIEWAAANLPRVVPQVHVEDGFGPEEASRQLPRRVWMRRVLLGWNGVSVVVASRNLERMATGVWKLPARRVRFLPNGVSIPAQERPANQLPSALDGVLRIGTVAGLRPEKNIGRLIRAFAEVRARHPARLVVVGGGPQQPELETLAQRLGVADAVEFTGYLKDPQSRLRELDLFALSSDTEQLPLALLEAMAVGMPVVATQVGDVGEVLADVSPQSLCAADDATFAQALQRVLASRDLWPAWSQAGRRKVQSSYALPRMVADWKRIFDGAGQGA